VGATIYSITELELAQETEEERPNIKQQEGGTWASIDGLVELCTTIVEELAAI